MKKLNSDQHEELLEAARCTARPGMHTPLLASLGLVVTGQGRFGGWVKATEEGRKYLARTAGRGSRAASKQVPAPVETKPDSFSPAATTGPAKAGLLLRGAAPRTRRDAAKNARGTSAINPPAVAQHVGGTSSMPLQRKPRAPRSGRVADVPARASGVAPNTKRSKRNAP